MSAATQERENRKWNQDHTATLLTGGGKCVTSVRSHWHARPFTNEPLEDKRRGLDRLKRDAITKAADVNSLICERFNDNGAAG